MVPLALINDISEKVRPHAHGETNQLVVCSLSDPNKDM